MNSQFKTKTISSSIPGTPESGYGYYKKRLSDSIVNVKNKAANYFGYRNKYSVYMNEKIIIGEIPTKTNRIADELHILSITHIISLVEDIEYKSCPMSSPIAVEQLADSGYLVFHAPVKEGLIHDNDTVLELVNYIKDIVQNKSDYKKVYIHCKSGNGRSPTLFAMYLSAIYPDKGFDEILSIISESRPEMKLSQKQSERILEFMIFCKNRPLDE